MFMHIHMYGHMYVHMYNVYVYQRVTYNFSTILCSMASLRTYALTLNVYKHLQYDKYRQILEVCKLIFKKGLEECISFNSINNFLQNLDIITREIVPETISKSVKKRHR
jgi:hypothetical protein